MTKCRIIKMDMVDKYTIITIDKALTSEIYRLYLDRKYSIYVLGEMLKVRSKEISELDTFNFPADKSTVLNSSMSVFKESVDEFDSFGHFPW